MKLFSIVVLALIAHVTISSSAFADKCPDAEARSLSMADAEQIRKHQFDPSVVAEVQSELLADSNCDIKGLLISRNGEIVFESYFNGHHVDALHDSRSTGKTVTAALVGIAISKGLIGGVHESVFAYLDDEAAESGSENGKENITFEHLLTMSSGLDADDADFDSPGNEEYLQASEDWANFAVSIPASNPPGEEWVYASLNTFLLGLALETITGEPLANFAEKELFEILEINEYEWAQTPKNRTVAQGNLSLKLRDLAKLGQLHLDGGVWGNRRVLSSEWVQASLQARWEVPWNGYDHYGYGWYRHKVRVNAREFEYFLASGNGGNKIYAFPKYDILIVIQSTAYNQRRGHQRSFDVMQRLLQGFLPSDGLSFGLQWSPTN